MGIKFSNNASTLLAGNIGAGDLSLSVTAGEGSLFPTLTGSDYFYCTLIQGITREVVKVTARSTDIFTIVRAQEGTSAQAFTTGAGVELRLTAQGIVDKVGTPVDIIGTVTDSSVAQNDVIEITHTAYSEANTALKRDILVMEETLGSSSTDSASLSIASATETYEFLTAPSGTITPSATAVVAGNSVSPSNSTTGGLNVGTTSSTTNQVGVSICFYLTGGSATGFSVRLGANTGTPTGTLEYHFGKSIDGNVPENRLNSSFYRTGTFAPTASATNNITFGSAITVTPGVYVLTIVPSGAEGATNRYYTIAGGTTSTPGSQFNLITTTGYNRTTRSIPPYVSQVWNSFPLNISITGGNATLIELTRSTPFSINDLGRYIDKTGSSGPTNRILNFKNIATGGTPTETSGFAVSGTTGAAIADIFDTNSASTYLSGTTTTTEYVTYDFGSAKTVRAFSVLVGNDVSSGTPSSETSDAGEEFDLRYSTDGTNYFSTPITQVYPSWGLHGQRYYSVTTPVSARYIRLYLLASTTTVIRKIHYYDLTVALVDGTFTNTSAIAEGSWSFADTGIISNQLRRYYGNGNTTVTFPSVDESVLESITSMATTVGAPSTLEDIFPKTKTTVSQVDFNSYGATFDYYSKYWFIQNRSTSALTAFTIDSTGVPSYLLTDSVIPTPTSTTGLFYIYVASLNAVFIYNPNSSQHNVQRKNISGNVLTHSWSTNTGSSNYRSSIGSKAFWCDTYQCVVAAGANSTSTDQYLFLWNATGTCTQVSVSLYSGTTTTLEIHQIDDTKYLLVSASNTNIVAKVVTITSATTATIGGLNTLLAITGTPYVLQLVRLSSTSFVAQISSDGTNFLGGYYPLTVSGTTVTGGTLFPVLETGAAYARVPHYVIGTSLYRVDPHFTSVGTVSGGVLTFSTPSHRVPMKQSPVTYYSTYGTASSFGTANKRLLAQSVYGFDYTNNGYLPVFDFVGNTVTTYATTVPADWYQLSFTFDNDQTYKIYKSATWTPIASKLNSIHGGTDTVWYYKNNGGTWTAAPSNTSKSAISTAMKQSNNLVSVSDYATYNTAILTSANAFVKSTTATFGAAFTFIAGDFSEDDPTSFVYNPTNANRIAGGTAYSGVDSINYGQTTRSAWNAVYTGYTVNMGRPDKVQITKTSAGTASVKAISFGERV